MITKKRLDPFDLIESVKDEATFLNFLQAMADDFAREREIERAKPSPPYSRGALGWENGRIDTFLDAAVAGSIGTMDKNTSNEANVWRRCAEIIYVGKIYE